MKYHPDIDLLLNYASGQLSPALSLAVSLHQQNCKKCQKLIKNFELIGGEMLDVLPDTTMAEKSFDNLLDSINGFEVNGSEFVEGSKQELIEQNDVALAEDDHTIFKSLFEKDYSNFVWEKINHNIRKAEIAINDPVYEVALLDIAPNTKVPKHTHRGREFTFVLQGNFQDQAGYYDSGDFIYQDDSNEHQPTTGKERCICLTVMDAPIKFTGTFGSVLNWLAK